MFEQVSKSKINGKLEFRDRLVTLDEGQLLCGELASATIHGSAIVDYYYVLACSDSVYSSRDELQSADRSSEVLRIQLQPGRAIQGGKLSSLQTEAVPFYPLEKSPKAG